MRLFDDKARRLIQQREKLRAELPDVTDTLERVDKQREIVQVEADIDRYLS